MDFIKFTPLTKQGVYIKEVFYIKVTFLVSTLYSVLIRKVRPLRFEGYATTFSCLQNDTVPFQTHPVLLPQSPLVTTVNSPDLVGLETPLFR